MKKKRFLWTMAPAQAAENHGDKCNIYINIYINSNLNPLTKLLAAAEAVSLKISYHKVSLK